MIKVIIVQQINSTNSGHFHCPENVPENDRRSVFQTNSGTWTNSGQFPDKLQCLKMLIFWITFRTMEMSGICTVSFLDKFRTNSGHSFFIGTTCVICCYSKSFCTNSIICNCFNYFLSNIGSSMSLEAWWKDILNLCMRSIHRSWLQIYLALC